MKSLRRTCEEQDSGPDGEPYQSQSLLAAALDVWQEQPAGGADDHSLRVDGRRRQREVLRRMPREQHHCAGRGARRVFGQEILPADEAPAQLTMI